MPRRTYSPSRDKAKATMTWAAEQEPESALVGIGAALVYALLEIAFQIGRVADNVPLWGPPEER